MSGGGVEVNFFFKKNTHSPDRENSLGKSPKTKVDTQIT